MDLELVKELGGEEGFSSQRLTLYLPNKDQEGQELFDLQKWVDQGRELLSQIGNGATAFPPAEGNWKNQKGELLWEQTRIIYCYIYPDQFLENLKNLRDFLHRFGRETNQGEVVVEFNGRFIRIKHFDVPMGG